MSSILLDVKEFLGYDNGNDFDTEILSYINSSFATLPIQSSAFPINFHVTGETETWDDFIAAGSVQDQIINYVETNVKLIFDPPQNSFTVQNMQKYVDKMEWFATQMTDKS